MIKIKDKEIDVQYLGLVDYAHAWQLQRDLFDKLNEAKIAGRDGEMTILLLEHPHVYTMGMHGNMKNLLFNDEFLKKIDAKYYVTERGGDVTYHGYGQLVGYPILDLEQLGMGIKQYIWSLEEAVIMTVAEYGIIASRVEGSVGVWLDVNTPKERKICAIGVKASRYITMHGFALNLTTNLDYFSYINPCGFIDKGVTSIEKETGFKPSINEVGEKFVKHFTTVVG